MDDLPLPPDRSAVLDLYKAVLSANWRALGSSPQEGTMDQTQSAKSHFSSSMRKHGSFGSQQDGIFNGIYH